MNIVANLNRKLHEARRRVATKRNPLNALFYDPVLDGPPLSVHDFPLPKKGQHRREGCWSSACKKHSGRQHCRMRGGHKLFSLKEKGLLIQFCSHCGVGVDDQGEFYRGADDYGKRFDPDG